MGGKANQLREGGLVKSEDGWKGVEHHMAKTKIGSGTSAAVLVMIEEPVAEGSNFGVIFDKTHYLRRGVLEMVAQGQECQRVTEEARERQGVGTRGRGREGGSGRRERERERERESTARGEEISPSCCCCRKSRGHMPTEDGHARVRWAPVTFRSHRDRAECRGNLPSATRV